jgi:ADP-ribose pyrophosphatase YjhB (NUDIX family)
MKHRIRVAGIVRHQQKILMIEQINPRTGQKHWALPGGGLDAQDANIFKAVEREVFEETGLPVVAKSLRFISEYSNPKLGLLQISIWINCDIVEGTDPSTLHLHNNQHDDNIADVRWWDPTALRAALHPQSNMSKEAFWEALDIPDGQVTYLGKRVEHH